MTILYWLLVVLMFVGVVGAVVPGIPGASLILIAIVVWGAVHSFSSVSIALGVAILVLLLSIGVDILATYLGAQQAGASKWGQIGAIVGLVLGFFGLLPAFLVAGPLIGILIGPLLGAIIGEFLYRRDLEFEPRIKLALKAGIGIVVGSLIGNLIQGLLAIAAVSVFLYTTWPPGAGV
ncbi:DUF456 family protein [Coleofasciculus sp. FACHB-1120]|uniref:DUF456 family protein n=1 Tax=Coleofasciculus sp. FACHB-1120 TaxID=2692783 RepID=UPI001683BC00|nr:DUF456 family protein [Coleofasciculus sp. FACHB-1120]